ncbi:MFS general substrate transporter [Biscogniauxia sp. FL1348]|nr:MFS general substrate transporter [Biscogniauxia sp. FL1348]
MSFCEERDLIDHGKNEDLQRRPPAYGSLWLLSLGTAFAIAEIMMTIDGTILATAAPRISSEFQALDHVGWYSSAYLLMEMSFQGLFAKAYLYFGSKTLYLSSICLFEIGSLICALASSSPVLILGRSVAGFGAAGMLAGSLTVLGQVVPLRSRARGVAIMVSIAMVSDMVGTTFGGLVADSALTWRFCFWVNLPLGALTITAISYTLENKITGGNDLPLKEKLRRIDLSSSILLLLTLVSFFIALEKGGITEPWTSPSVIFSLFGAVTFAAIFIATGIQKKETAMVPLRFFQQRTVIICCAFTFLFTLADVTHDFLMPIWFQGVKDMSATSSAIYCLPGTIATVTGILITGFTTTKFGYNAPFMWMGSSIHIVGSILRYRLNADSSAWQYISYQMIDGIGSGLAGGVSFIAIQACVPEHQMPLVASLVIFFQRLGGTVGISVAQNLFLGSLQDNLEHSDSIIEIGIYDLVKESQSQTSEEQIKFKNVFNTAIMNAYLFSVITISLAALVGCGLEWRKLPDVADSVEFEDYELVQQDAEIGTGQDISKSYNEESEADYVKVDKQWVP